MTDKDAGPARVVWKYGYYHIEIGGWRSMSNQQAQNVDEDCRRLNLALAPLTRKAALCERMAEKMRDLFPILDKDAKELLVEFDRAKEEK